MDKQHLHISDLARTLPASYSDAVGFDTKSEANPLSHSAQLTPSSQVAFKSNDILALQRTLGNQAVQRILTSRSLNGISTPHSSSRIQREESQEGDIKVSLATDKEAESVGHAWVMIEKPGGKKDSYGFWPAGGPAWLAVLEGMSISSEGQVIHPDTAHTPNALFTINTDKKGLSKGIQYAKRKANSRYHLFVYNCSTFARTMFEEATGVTPPSGGLLVDSPNELADAIKEKNEEKGLDSMERPLRGSSYNGYRPD